MHRHSRSEAAEISSPRSSRAASFSSDRPSIAGSISFQIPSNIRPAPAYIAASVASQIVTDHHNAQLRDELDLDNDDSAPYLANALFSQEALVLLNAFLDNLLYSFLSTAQSPSLTAVRPAITDVLKPRLAREAMATADEELQGLLAGEDDEEFPHNGHNPHERWDVERVWKRTRLRIMVYTRLGELEDEDEERYVQQERGLSLDDSGDDEAGLVSWASAIFLTSVIEYIAEQTLVVSGQAAFARLSAKMKKDAQKSTDGEEFQLERIIVEEFDVEKIALNSTLGRLWRTWRKRVRSPIMPLPSPRTPRSVSAMNSPHFQRRSRGEESTLDGEASRSQSLSEAAEHGITETDIAANIPLPIGVNDVDEIEVPGLARQFDEDSEGAQTPTVRPSQRPASSIMLSSTQYLLDDTLQGRSRRERPVSMPIPRAAPFTFPPQSVTDDDDDFVTPMERMSEDRSYIEHMSDTEDSRAVDAAISTLPVPNALAVATNATVPESGLKETLHEKEEDDNVETPTHGGEYVQPEVLQSKRMSIEKSGPPEIVRTFSSRSTRSSSGTQPKEGKSYLEGTQTGEDDDDTEAIGVARTTNIPVPATPSPPSEPVTNGTSTIAGKDPEYRRLLDVAQKAEQRPNRSHSASPASARKTPSPVDRPVTSEKLLASHQKGVIPPRSTSASTRTPTLSSLQEAESWTQESQTLEKRKPESHRGTSQSPKHTTSRRSREIPVAERPGKRQSSESARSGTRERSGTTEGVPVERATLQRVPSSSSTTKSASTSILHSTRNSESSIGRSRGLSTRMSEEDREREFDSLVRGEETVKYTLTPQSMREYDAPPVVRQDPPQQTTSVTVYPRVNSEPGNSFGSRPPPARSSSRGKGPIASEQTGASTRPSSNRNNLAAREPRIQTESMRDFADFIRSTGPVAGDERPVQPFISLSNSASKAPASSSSSPMSGLGRKVSTRQSAIQPAGGVAEGSPARSRVHMEPRSPAGQHSGNDELIDFIRQGPPGANNGQHRIPRTVAPFRTTVDSDQFDRMLDDPSVDNSHPESMYGSQASMNSKQSTRTSANSRTGLLPAPTVVQPAYSNTPQHLAGSLSSPEPQITRTRRRVKDPYAIDSDDEDEDLLTALPKSKRGEESLIDFLRNSEPPANNDPKPLMTNGAMAAAAAARSRAPNGTNSASSSARSPPLNQGMGASSSRSVPSSSAGPAIISSTITAQAPRANKPKLQARVAGARDARSSRSETNDLADFLRTSGPPEPPAPAPGNTIRKEEGKRLNTRFWRKKTYPDMP